MAGLLRGRLAIHHISRVHTGHGLPSFQPFPDDHDFFAVRRHCRDAVSLSIVFATDQILGLALGGGLRRRLGYRQRRDETHDSDSAPKHPLEIS